MNPSAPIQRLVAQGGVRGVAGFSAGVVHCGLKADRPDLVVLHNEGPHPSAAAVFTRNTFAAAPVHVSRQNVANGDVRAVVINAGIANACTGRQGLRDALEMARLTADATGVTPGQVLVASTGIIGRPLPMDIISDGIKAAAANLGDGADAPSAILTTDSGPKTHHSTIMVDGQTITISGFAKGAGMIHPDMATMLAFILTDARVDSGFLQTALRNGTDLSFNQISVDGDPSTNDMATVLASGTVGNEITADHPDASAFQDALTAACTDLATQIAADGEGATRLLDVQVDGATDNQQARKAARAVVSSFLVKAAVHGADANWGRVLAAVGATNVDLDSEKVRLAVSSSKGTVIVLEDGAPTGDDGRQVMDAATVRFHLDLGVGNGSGSAWGCDVSPESVSFNSSKTT
jgi:glutamate N-acetyltransferase/amino-acid N-acetyltransferase